MLIYLAIYYKLKLIKLVVADNKNDELKYSWNVFIDICGTVCSNKQLII
jgi:hypothetical protein